MGEAEETDALVADKAPDPVVGEKAETEGDKDKTDEDDGGPKPPWTKDNPNPAGDFIVGEGMSCHFPDYIFSIAWLFTVLAVVVIALEYGFPEFEDLELYFNFLDDDQMPSTKILYIPAYAIAIVSTGSICWIIIMLLCGKMLMWSFLLAIIGGSGYAAVALYTDDSSSGSTMAMPFALICLFMVMYACAISSRIAFASTTLEIACHVILQYFSLIFMSLIMVAVTAAYLMLWIVALLGLYIYMNDVCDDSYCSGTTNTIIIYSCMLLCFFWTAEVLKNIVTVTTVGVVALWWTGQGGALAVPLSFCRASTWNLGAICFGSLLVAIITTLCYVIMFLQQQAKKSGNKVAEYALMCLACIMNCIKKCMEYLTAYAYCFVGIYGHSFIKAGYNVMVLIGNDLPLLLSNDGLVGTVILVGQLICTGLGAYTSYYMCETKSDWVGDFPDAEQNLIVMGASIGWALSGIVFGIISAGNKAALILWMEKPDYLKVAHPVYYDKLDYIWTKSMGRIKAQSALDDEFGDKEEGGTEGDAKEEAKE